MLIHFVHLGDAYLPELQAYTAYVRAAGHEAQVHRHIDTVPRNAAVLWWMCGQVNSEMAKRFPGAFQIHEYASTSVPPLACKYLLMKCRYLYQKQIDALCQSFHAQALL